MCNSDHDFELVQLDEACRKTSQRPSMGGLHGLLQCGCGHGCLLDVLKLLTLIHGSLCSHLIMNGTKRMIYLDTPPLRMYGTILGSLAGSQKLCTRVLSTSWMHYVRIRYISFYN